MTRLEVFRKMAEANTTSLDHLDPADAEPSSSVPPAGESAAPSDLFVWFEDSTARVGTTEGCGIAGLPECLLPWPQDPNESMRVIDRDYAPGHPHLLSAVRLRLAGDVAARTVALYTSALSVGTVAWIGIGPQYERAWNDVYTADAGNGPPR